jgi:hypothetical protein
MMAASVADVDQLRSFAKRLETGYEKTIVTG